MITPACVSSSFASAWLKMWAGTPEYSGGRFDIGSLTTKGSSRNLVSVTWKIGRIGIGEVFMKIA